MSKKLFESTTEGIIRYFVRPNDDFVLNSLEKIDADEYLYRVLKNEGYERIVFVEIEKTNCKYYTYDKLSHLSLQHQKEFANVIPDSLESISDFFSRVKAKIDKNDSGPAGLKKMGSKSEATYDKIPELGKREIKRFSKLEEFVADFANYVSNALEAENIKTAVVVQMEVFEQSFNKELGIARRIASQLGDIVRYCEKNNSAMQNIVVLTTTQKENFRNLVNNELLHNFHSWIPEVLSETTSGAMLVRNITDRLNEYGCLVMSESIGVDEIANLLLRKKIVDNDAMFDGLPFSKIYPLAEKLRIHLTYETKVFSDNIPFERRKSFINPLNALLQRRTVVEELIAYAQGLESKVINNVNTQSISVERVFHNRIKYIDIDESAEILVEFDKLEGDEIQDVKRDVLRAVNYFEGMKKELEEKERQGKKVSADDFPYLNMLFFGAPGTGKTTIANLVGRLMYAKGILPTSKVHIVQASELGSGRVHGVQEKLFEEAEKAIGGVLLIDELQAIKGEYQGGDLAEDFMRGLVSVINRYRDTMCVILCGYEEEVLRIIKYDDGASRRFPQKVKLESYSIDTLMVILQKLLVANGKSLGNGVEEKIRKIILADMKTQGKTFGNVGYLKEELIGPIKAAYFERGQNDNVYIMEDLITAFAGTDKRTILDEAEDSVQSIISEFDKLEGDEIQDAKRDALRAVNYFEGVKKELEEKEKQGKKINSDDYPYYNMLFFGAPGTGKTTIANLVGRLMYAKGILPTSKVHVVQAGELGSGIVHGVQENLFKEAEKAIGGVLLIDELQALKDAYREEGGSRGGGMAEDLMRALVSIINKYRDCMCVILCGYEEDVLSIIKFDDGASRRFPKKIKLSSYSIDTLMVIFNKLLESDGKSLGHGVEEKIRKFVLADMKTQGKTFGNVGYLKEELIAPIKAAYFERGQYDNNYTIDDLMTAFADTDKRTILEECEDSIQTIISEFDKLEGDEIQDAKRDVLRAVNYFEGMKKELEEKERQGKKVSADDFPYLNMLFFGAPGTGKTTIANLVGRLMYAKGILPTSKVHIVQASELGSGRVHGVQEKLFEEAEKAIGGVLLIDELQAIKGEYQGGDLAEDFMRGLVSVINKYRDNMCVILCGYEEEVLRIIKYDDGAGRRFPKKIKLVSYSIDTLMVILNKLLEADNKSLENGVLEILRKIILADMKAQGKTFGNVGYLKEELIAPIKAAYFERGQYDNIYTIADVEVAFPTIKNNKDSEGHKAKQRRYKRVSRAIFANLPEPYGSEATASRIKLNETTDPAILFVKTDKGAGTAFLVSPDGYAITCNHVIEGATEITARLRILGRPGGSDSFYKCEVVNTKKDYDIALIKLLDGTDFPYLKLADCNRKIIKGEEFLLSGYPFGDRTAKDLTTFYGSIASSELQKDDYGYIRFNIDCQAKCGDSGAPIIATSDGCVIGILLGSITNSSGQLIEEINHMRPIKYFWEEFLK